MGQPAPQCRGIEYVDECPGGWIPKLNERNGDVWQFYRKVAPGLFRETGYDFKAIELAFSVYDVSFRDVYMDRLLLIIEAVDEVRRAQSQN